MAARDGRRYPARRPGRRHPYSRRAPRCPPRTRVTIISLICLFGPSAPILSVLSRMAMGTNEVQASGEDSGCVVVEGRDVVAVRAFPDLQPGRGQRLAQDRQAGWADDMILCAVIHEGRSGDLA